MSPEYIVDSTCVETSVYEPSYDVKKEIENWVRDVVEDDNVLLSKTGFNVAANVAQYILLNRQGNREGYKSATEQDILGHTLEFSLGRPVIPYDIALSDEEPDGRKTILTRDYVSGEYVPLSSLLDPNERSGAVVRRTELLEQIFSDAKPGDVFVTTSPAGWHGMTNNQGIPYTEYNHTQTALYVLGENNQIQAFTVRSSMTQLQNEQLLTRVSQGLYTPLDTTSHIAERIVDVVDTVVKAANVHSAADLVKMIEGIRQSDVFWENIKYTGEHIKSWDAKAVLSEALTSTNSIDTRDQISTVLDQFWQNVQTNIHGESVDEIRLLSHYIRDAVLQASFAGRKHTLAPTAVYNQSEETSYNEGQAGCVSVTVRSEFGERSVSELVEEFGIDYPFDIKGRCRSKGLCLSGNEGHNQWLAACHFCLHCDIGIRIGVLNVADITKQSEQENQKEDIQVETAEEIHPFAAVFIGILLINIFSN